MGGNTITMKKNIQKWAAGLVFAGVVAFGAVGLIGQAAHAQSGELRLTNSGVPINLVATPGTTTSTDISIRNTGAQAETLKTSLMKFGAKGDEGKPALSDREPGDDYFDWLTVSPSQFTVEANESKTVRVTINVPKEAAFGYYYAITFSRAADEKPAKGQAVKGAIATLVLLEARVPGAKRELQVADFSTTESLYEFLPATFKVKIKNTGNVHAVPHGDIAIDQGNSELARLPINPAGGYILPGSNRVFTVQWNDGFPRHIPKVENGKVVIDKGEAQKQLEIDWGRASKFRIGQYTANLLMVYDDGKRDVPIERQTQFQVIPWKLLLVVAAIIALIVWAIVNDIIKLEHFLFRGKTKKNRSASVATSRKTVRKPAAKKTVRKKAPVSRKKK